MVCHQIRSPDNLGAVARLMANFGFGDLRLSDPLTYALRDADRLAVKGAHVLEGLRLCRTLDEALADCVYVCGTTSRAQVKGRAPSTPEQALATLAERAAGGKVALVFGGEKRGLSDEELSLCHDVLVIPTDAAQPSMNLAQSAAVLLYLGARAFAPAVKAPTVEPAAQQGTLKALEGTLQEVLLACDFLNPQAPEHVLRELTRSLVKGAVSQREALLWLTAFKQVRRVVKPSD